jgi:hypothetical protein
VGVAGHDPLQAIGDVEGDQQRHGEQHHPADLPGEHGPRPESGDPLGHALAGQREHQERDRRTQGEVDGEHHGTEADAVMRAHHGDSRQHRPRARDEERAQAQPEDEPSGVPVGLALGDAGEGSLEEMSEGRNNEPGCHDAEDDEPGVGQEVLG